MNRFFTFLCLTAFVVGCKPREFNAGSKVQGDGSHYVHSFQFPSGKVQLRGYVATKNDYEKAEYEINAHIKDRKDYNGDDERVKSWANRKIDEYVATDTQWKTFPREELNALYWYTNHPNEKSLIEMQGALFNESNILSHYEGIIKTLSSALTRIKNPPQVTSNTTLYSIQTIQNFEAWQPGKTYLWKAFLSTTYEKHVIDYQLTNIYLPNAMFIIKSHHSARKIPDFLPESEVLFPPGADFRIVARHGIQKIGLRQFPVEVIELEEK